MSSFVVAYGAEELKRVAHRNGLMAMSISILIHFSIIGCYYLAASLTTDEPRSEGERIITVELPPFVPPRVYELPRGGGYTAPTKVVERGTPVPVADDPVSIERTIPTSEELLQHEVGDGVDGASREPVEGVGGVVGDEIPPEPFVPVEKDPILVKAVQPVYPPFALRAGLEGTVVVRIWVDRQGKPHQVVVLKSDSDLFNEAALDAARQFVFTPAYMNSGPVSVWVTVPIRFKLVGTK